MLCKELAIIRAEAQTLGADRKHLITGSSLTYLVKYAASLPTMQTVHY